MSQQAAVASDAQTFRDAWGEEFVEGGLGAVIDVPR